MGCGHPSPPANGSISSYTSTMVGTRITFQCDEGYSPSEALAAECQEDGRWKPNPSEIICLVKMTCKYYSTVRMRVYIE